MPNYLLLGTCGAGAFADFPHEGARTVSHMLWDARTPVKLPSESQQFDAIIVAMTQRYIIDDAGDKGNDLLFHRLHAQDQLVTMRDTAYGLISEQVEHLATHFAGRPVFFLAFLEQNFNARGLLLPNYTLENPAYFMRQLNEHMERATAAFENAHFIDVNQIANWIGNGRINDHLLNATFHGNYLSNWDYEFDRERAVKPTPAAELFNSDDSVRAFKTMFWKTIENALSIIRRENTVKLIIIDLDDTLWRGIAAEDDLEPHQRIEGWALGFAEALLYFKNRGGLLAISSKNDAQKTLENMQRIYGWRITAHDFASVKIGWNRKSDSVAEILKEINVLPENTVFIDDNPREVDDVLAAFPGIRTLGFDHYLWRSKILLDPAFQVPHVSEESRNRTALAQQSIKRREEKASIPHDEWMQSLQLVAKLDVIGGEDHPKFKRAFELLNKTNQFNTTGKRWDNSEIAALFQRGGCLISISVADKSIDNGLTGVAVIDGASIEQAVLSCRVFGLGIENMLTYAALEKILSDHDSATARLTDTGKNFSCHDHFKQYGFDRTDAGWVTKVVGTKPAWIQLA